VLLSSGQMMEMFVGCLIRCPLCICVGLSWAGIAQSIESLTKDSNG